MPLLTAMPVRIIIPIRAGTDKVRPKARSPATTPINPRGTVNMITKGVRSDSNWAAIIMYTSMIATTNAHSSPENASSMS